MMKRIYISLLMLWALTSCQESIIVPDVVVDEVMRFNFIVPGVQTKVTDGGFEPADQIGVYVTDYADDATPLPLQVSGNRANNFPVVYDGASWTSEKTVYWGDGKADVYAYYPCFESVNDVHSQYFEIAADQSADGYEESDFLWAKAEGVCQSEGKVNLEMKHVMSKLKVRIVAGEEYIGSLPQDASVLLHSTVTGARINLETGSVVKDPYSGTKSIKMRNLGISSDNGVETVVYEAIVLPQMLETKVPLLEINSKSVSYIIEDVFIFRPGIAYVYTVTLNTSTNAIKVEIGCEIEDWNNVGGDSGNDGEGGEDSGESGETDDSSEYMDLSADGTANCYLLQQAGDYKFKAVMGNTDGTVGNVKSVEVLWESFGTEEMPEVGDLISSVSYKNGYVCFSTPDNFRNGNALIAAKNSKGVILWSWHIWCAEEGWKEQVYYNGAGTMMDRNLGATSATPGNVGALGLMYQWGRKDPFLSGATIKTVGLAASTGVWKFSSNNSTVDDEENNPMTFFTNRGLLNMVWESSKTAYDPCPVGWRIPDGGDDGVWAKALGTSSNVSVFYDSENRGVDCAGKLCDAECVWYPDMGVRSTSQDGNLRFSSSGYWSCTSFPDSVGQAYYFAINGGTVNPLGNYYYSNKSFGYSVRCQKDE